jgi:hypothetical protein
MNNRLRFARSLAILEMARERQAEGAGGLEDDLCA